MDDESPSQERLALWLGAVAGEISKDDLFTRLAKMRRQYYGHEPDSPLYERPRVERYRR